MWLASLRIASTLFLVPAAATAAATDVPCRTDEQSYGDENRVAMDRMMAGMNVASSGDVDRDFATAMIAHHQGAIDMARAELRHGDDPKLRRIAQGIVVEQQQEIQAMRLALGKPPRATPSADVEVVRQVAGPEDCLRSDRGGGVR